MCIVDPVITVNGPNKTHCSIFVYNNYLPIPSVAVI